MSWGPHALVWVKVGAIGAPTVRAPGWLATIYQAASTEAADRLRAAERMPVSRARRDALRYALRAQHQLRAAFVLAASMVAAQSAT